MSESIWKKEIHLRKPKAPKEPKAEVVVEAAPVETPPETSIWKKEIRLRKQPEPLPPLPAHLLERQRVREVEPVRDGRPRGTVVVPVRPDRPEPLQRIERWTARVPAPHTEFPRPAAGEEQDPVALLPRERATVDPAPALPPLPTPTGSYGWTSPLVAAEPEDDAVSEEHLAPAAPEPEPRSFPTTFAPASFLENDAASYEPAPRSLSDAFSAFTAPAPEPEPEADLADQPEAAVPSELVSDTESDTPEVTAARSLSDAYSAFTAAAPEPEPEADEPEAVSTPEPVSDAAVSDTPAAAAAPSLGAAFSAFTAAPPESADEPEAAVTPELPAVEPAPAPAAAEKVPLLKREIHLSRKPKAKKPKPAEPKAKKEKKEKSVPAEPKDKTPLLKRELRLPRPGPRRAHVDTGHKVTRVVGLRIGSSQLAAAHVRNNGSHEVLQLARTELDSGLVVAGEVREPVALAKALKSFFAANRLPRKDIRLGVASNRIGIRVLDVPAVDDHKQFENAIRFRAQETLPIPVADAVLDHVVIDERANEEGDAVRRVLLVFAHRELVSQYVDVCRQAGLRLAGIDLDAFALLRAVEAQSGDGPPRACVAVALGHERTIFAVSDGTVCDFTRVLEWGGSALDVAIARALNVTPSQAEPIKRAMDLDDDEPPAGLSPMQFEAARAAAKAEIGQLVRELSSSLRFYQSREDSLAIGEIILAGGGAQLPGLAAEVQRGLGAPVRVADPFAQVSLARKLQIPDETGSLAIAVGLGIEV